MYDLPIILGVFGVFILILLIFNIFFVYQPILELGSEVKRLQSEVDKLIERFRPQIEFVESLLT